MSLYKPDKFDEYFSMPSPIVYSEEIHQLVPNSKFYVFEESNHTPYLEGNEKFNEMVKDYINLV